MTSNITISQNISSSFSFDFSSTPLVSHNLTFFFNSPPPPPFLYPRHQTRIFTILDCHLFKIFSNWITKTIELNFKKLLDENKGFISNLVKSVSISYSNAYTSYPVFGATSMKYELVERFKNIEFSLDPDQELLVLKWEGHSVTYHYRYVEDSSKPFSAIFDHSAYGAEQIATLTPLRLREGLTAYVEIPNQQNEPQKKILQLFQLKNELTDWCNEHEIGQDQREKRTLATTKIIDYLENKDNALDLNDIGLTSLPPCIGLVLRTQLNAWCNEHGIDQDQKEKRALATTKIMDYFQNQRYELDLNGMGLTSLPPCIGLVLRTQLNAWCNEHEIDQDQTEQRRKAATQIINCFKNKGKELVIEYFELTSLPSCISLLINLERFALYSSKIKEFPLSICKLTSLKSLVLYYSAITFIPTEIDQLKQLTRLDLSNGKITKLPESLCSLKQLESLSLSGNKLTQLPNNIGDLENLYQLDLSSNELECFPTSFSELKKLETLFLSRNKLKTLDLNFSNFTNLVDLNLSNNQLTALPEDICKLINLRSLDVRENLLQTLPENIDKLVALTNFFTFSNPYQNLPSTIFKLPEQLFLDFSGHQLNLEVLVYLNHLYIQLREAGRRTPRVIFHIVIDRRRTLN